MLHYRYTCFASHPCSVQPKMHAMQAVARTNALTTRVLQHAFQPCVFCLCSVPAVQSAMASRRTLRALSLISMGRRQWCQCL